VTDGEDRWNQMLSELRSATAATDRLRHATDQLSVDVWRSERSLSIRSALVKFAPGAIFLDSKYDLAIVGLARTCCSSGGSVVRVVYDIDKLVQLMIEVDGVSQEHAAEWMTLQSAIEPERAPVFMIASPTLEASP
jgi:hypothetical protein